MKDAAGVEISIGDLVRIGPDGDVEDEYTWLEGVVAGLTVDLPGNVVIRRGEGLFATIPASRVEVVRSRAHIYKAAAEGREKQNRCLAKVKLSEHDARELAQEINNIIAPLFIDLNILREEHGETEEFDSIEIAGERLKHFAIDLVEGSKR